VNQFVLGVDPGATCGLCLVSWSPLGWSVKEYATVRTKPVKGAPGARMFEIWCKMDAVTLNYRPTLVAIEDPRTAQVDQYRRGSFTPKTATLNAVVGLALGWAFARRIGWTMITPRGARKRAMGSGKAEQPDITEWFKETCDLRTSEHVRNAAVVAVAGARELQEAERERTGTTG
jgi:Holliday junction resolvasome RuvABC endonuclease subunit